MMTMDFYDAFAPHYHLIYPDWDRSMALQAEQLDHVVQQHWPGAHQVLDVACGIGTQALGLAALGYTVVASDLSRKEVERAGVEAEKRQLTLALKVGDMRQAHALHGGGFDVLMACDNSVPHLLNDEDLLQAFRQFFACLKPGGGCLITVRDYVQEARGRNLVKHYGARVEDGKRYVLFQVWDFEGSHYDFSFFVVEEDLATGQVHTHVMRSRYYAISTERLCELMQAAGFAQVQRLDGCFYQPVLVGTRPQT
jgi:SAM-dependent methyltransferase